MPVSGQSLFVLVLCVVASFLICGVPFGLIFGRIFGGTDIRAAGSGNIGTTNALRVAGPKVAVLTLVCDVLKAVVCIRIAYAVLASFVFGGPSVALDPGQDSDWMINLVALSCLCGHIFSPYLHFKGGKGIAVGVGVLFGIYWPLALVHLAIFAVLVAATKYVSLGSIVTAAAAPITYWIAFPHTSFAAELIMACLSMLIIWAHRSNIKKLVHHTESKLSFTKRTNTKDDAA